MWCSHACTASTLNGMSRNLTRHCHLLVFGWLLVVPSYLILSASPSVQTHVGWKLAEHCTVWAGTCARGSGAAGQRCLTLHACMLPRVCTHAGLGQARNALVAAAADAMIIIGGGPGTVSELMHAWSGRCGTVLRRM